MNSLFITTQKNRVQGVAVSLLLIFALAFPQFARAEHSTSLLPDEAYTVLVEKYKSGELVFHAPGRRDDSPFAFIANPELRLFRSYVVSSQQSRGADADSARWVALGSAFIGESEAYLAVNPELQSYRNYLVSSIPVDAGDADSARWAALGAALNPTNDAATIAENPELRVFRGYVTKNVCDLPGQIC